MSSSPRRLLWSVGALRRTVEIALVVTVMTRQGSMHVEETHGAPSVQTITLLHIEWTAWPPYLFWAPIGHKIKQYALIAYSICAKCHDFTYKRRILMIPQSFSVKIRKFSLQIFRKLY